MQGNDTAVNDILRHALETLDSTPEIPTLINPTIHNQLKLRGKTIQRLDLTSLSMPPKVARLIVTLFPNLQKLNCTNCSIGDSALTHIATLSSLTDLNISRGLITDPSLEKLSLLPKLKRLNLWGGSLELTPAGFERILPQLEYLSTSSPAIGRIKIETPLPKLNELHLSCSEENSGLTVEKIILLVPSLTSLSIRNAKSITNATIQHIAQHLPRLTSLDFQGSSITNKDLQQLQPLSQLTHLNIGSCETSPEKAPHLELANFPSLTSLNLSYRKTTDSNLLDIITTHPELKKLTLTYCINITNIALQHIVNKLPLLTELILNFCENLTKEDVESAFKKLSKLTLLGINADKTSYAIAKECLHKKKVQLLLHSVECHQ